MQVITFNACNGLRVSYLSIMNSPRSHINVNDCVDATFSDITIHSPATSPNTDGFDVYASKNIWIRDSTIACGNPSFHLMHIYIYISISIYLYIISNFNALLYNNYICTFKLTHF